MLDSEGEEFSFQNDWDILIPLSLEKIGSRELSAVAIPRFEEGALAHLTLFEGSPFSDRAVAALRERLLPYEHEWGYRLTRHSFARVFILQADFGGFSPQNADLAVELTADDEDRNETTYDIEMTIKSGRLAYGVIDGGRIVALAVTHASPLGLTVGDAIEIGVETVPSARGKGYAKAALSRMTEELLARGLVPEYRARRANRASLAVARAVGYRRVGDSLDVVMELNRKKGAASVHD